jgi:hypothetical protein
MPARRRGREGRGGRAGMAIGSARAGRQESARAGGLWGNLLNRVAGRSENCTLA